MEIIDLEEITPPSHTNLQLAQKHWYFGKGNLDKALFHLRELMELNRGRDTKAQYYLDTMRRTLMGLFNEEFKIAQRTFPKAPKRKKGCK